MVGKSLNIVLSLALQVVVLMQARPGPYVLGRAVGHALGRAVRVGATGRAGVAGASRPI